MSSVPRTVAALSSDGLSVNRWDGRRWKQIGDAVNTLYGGGFTLLGTNPASNEVSTWTTRNNWIRLGGSNAKYVVTSISVYALTFNRDGVWKWNNDGANWTQIGGPASDIVGGGYNTLFGLSPDGTEIWHWLAADKWEKVGGPGAQFVVDGQGHLYGLAVKKEAVFKWTGAGQAWTKIGGPASRLFAGGQGLFALDPTGNAIFRWTGVADKWEKVGGPGVDFVVTDDGLFGLNSVGEVWKHETGEKWTNLGASPTAQIVASP